LNNSDFVHLHLHSTYSQLDGVGKPDQYAAQAKKLGFDALAVTDHGNVDGHIKWQKSCDKAGIDPILGSELYIIPDLNKKEKEKRGHITVLCKNLKGWQELCRLLTIANLDGFYRKPRIDFETLRQADLSGLILMTACSNSVLNLPSGETFILELMDKGASVYLEIMPHQLKEQIEINEICLRLNKDWNIPLVATNDCHYVYSDQTKTQEVLLAIQRKAKWNDPKRWKFEVQGLHLRTTNEMVEAFKRQECISSEKYYEAIQNTLVVAELCKGFRIPRQKIALPETKYEKESRFWNSNQILSHLCEKGAKRIFDGKEPPNEYHHRLKRETTLISKKGFARYFLMVCELIEWCKQNDIMCGPGRGSSGGSLTAYYLGITQVDPIKYGLLFERFISEDRIDWPDIDIDIENTKTDLVRQHLENEYGENNVSGISTFLELKSRSAIRDIGRVFDLPFKDVDEFAKSIYPNEHDSNAISIAGQTTPEGKRFAARYPDEFKLACDLEGQIRNSGRHPAGIIVSDENLTTGKRGNLARRSGHIVCNWDMEDCEFNGLIKIDALKLVNMTVLNEAKKLIIKNHGKQFDYPAISLDDSAIFKSFSEGQTANIFQLSGAACTSLCTKIKIESLEGMAVVSALARPGPFNSGMTELYIKRKNGEAWNSIHPAHEEITKETYGVVVYQEQMMQCMVGLAGFSESDADRVRKVIGKKRKAEEFEPYRLAFIDGCIKKKTLTKRQAENFWAGLLEWASYGFVKSHAIEYALIGYWTAYIKKYYESEFLSAQLTYGADKEQAINEALRLGYKIITPKTGISDAHRWLCKDKQLFMPFVEINGVGENQAVKCAEMKSRKVRKGFFNLDAPVGKTKLEQLLNEIKAFDPDLFISPKDHLKYFQYKIS
jgi:DNA polymerase-3 subunit alpha